MSEKEYARTILPSAQQQSEAFVFDYQAPANLEHRRGVTRLVHTDLMMASIQLFTRGGGERNLHSHDALDGFWFVLAGRAKFYGPGDALTADLGPHQGVFLPRGVAYWFEQVGDEPLQILQVEAVDPNTPNDTRFYGKSEEIVFERFTIDGERIGETRADPAKFT